MGQSGQVFILGAPRSGTTFLASLLGLTRFGKPFETHFITKYFKKLSSYGGLDKKANFKKLIGDILNERAVMQWKLNLDIDEFYNSQGGDFSYASIVNNLCLLRNKRLGFSAWGDKTPHYIGDFKVILSLFPDARFIYIVRDGRDVALSLLEKNWGPNNIYSCAKYWKKLNKRHIEFDRLEDSGQLIRLSYEDLLDNTELNVRKVYDFLEEDINEVDLLKFCQTVKAGNYFKWKSKLTQRQIKIFDYVAANTLTRFGYETFDSESGVNGFLRIPYILHNKFLFYKFLFEMNVIEGFKIRFLGKEPFAE